jgi:hypothetical protein
MSFIILHGTIKIHGTGIYSGALLSGILIVMFANTAVQCSFIHVLTATGLESNSSIDSRRPGMFLAGIQ